MRHLQGFHPVGEGETRWVTGGAVQERAMQPPADTLLTAPTGSITAGLVLKTTTLWFTSFVHAVDEGLLEVSYTVAMPCHMQPYLQH